MLVTSSRPCTSSRSASPSGTSPRPISTRCARPIFAGDIEAALTADDELHAVPVTAASNQALATVLDQFTPVLRRAEVLRFSSVSGSASADRHDDLIQALADGDADRAAQIAAGTWSTLGPR
jgi:DNA-binding GntR family transcriptional regulator